jgi:hypothetical protein
VLRRGLCASRQHEARDVGSIRWAPFTSQQDLEAHGLGRRDGWMRRHMVCCRRPCGPLLNGRSARVLSDRATRSSTARSATPLRTCHRSRAGLLVLVTGRHRPIPRSTWSKRDSDASAWSDPRLTNEQPVHGRRSALDRGSARAETPSCGSQPVHISLIRAPRTHAHGGPVDEVRGARHHRGRAPHPAPWQEGTPYQVASAAPLAARPRAQLGRPRSR